MAIDFFFIGGIVGVNVVIIVILIVMVFVIIIVIVIVIIIFIVIVIVIIIVIFIVPISSAVKSFDDDVTPCDTSRLNTAVLFIVIQCDLHFSASEAGSRIGGSPVHTLNGRPIMAPLQNIGKGGGVG